jgi:hypothetical protein
MTKAWMACWRRVASILMVCAVGILLVGAGTATAQTVIPLSQIKKIYVDSLGAKKGSTELRDALVKRLRKVRGLEVVSTKEDADAVITGTGELWVKGYYTTNPRPSAYGQNAIFGGMLSVEVKDKHNETLWSYLVTPGKFHWDSVAQNLADLLVKKFEEALQASNVKGASH